MQPEDCLVVQFFYLSYPISVICQFNSLQEVIIFVVGVLFVTSEYALFFVTYYIEYHCYAPWKYYLYLGEALFMSFHGSCQSWITFFIRFSHQFSSCIMEREISCCSLLILGGSVLNVACSRLPPASCFRCWLIVGILYYWKEGTKELIAPDSNTGKGMEGYKQKVVLSVW